VLADNIDASFMWVSPRHVKEAESFSEILDVTRFTAPTVLFLEDLDLFAEERDSKGWMGLGELMNQLDGAVDNEDIVTIATTNRLEAVEKALRNRPGRFDRIVHLGPLDTGCRRLMLERQLNGADIDETDFDELIEATDDYTGSQLEELVNTLYILAVASYNNRTACGGCDELPTEGRIRIERSLIEAALCEMQFERKQRIGFHLAETA